MNRKQFTLVEVLVAIVVISILVAIVTVNVSKFKERAIIASIKTDARTLQMAVDLYVKDKEKYPTIDFKKPELGEASEVALNELIPDYIKQNTFRKDVYWYVDSNLTVYPTFAKIPEDAEFIAENEENIITFSAVQKASEYEIVEVNERGVVVGSYGSFSPQTVTSEGKVRLFYAGLSNREGTYLAIRVKDNYLFETPALFKIDKVGEDNEMPVIELSEDSTYRKSHTIQVKVTDNKVVKRVDYSWSTSSSVPTTGWTGISPDESVTMSSVTGKYYLHVKAEDGFGNIAMKKTSRNFDNISPVISMSDDDSVKSSHRVNISATDNIEVKEIKYAWTKTETRPSSFTENLVGSSVELSEVSGIYYLHVLVTDIAGNTAYKNTLRHFDNEPPVITLEEYNEYAKYHTVEIKASDDHSINKLEYAWNTSEVAPTMGWLEVDSTNTVFKDIVTGEYYLHVRASDKAGNLSAASTTRYFDNIKPTIVIPKDESAKKSHLVSIMAHDNIELAKVEYVWTDQETKPTAGWIETVSDATFTLDVGDGLMYLHVRAVDTAGNEEYAYGTRFIDVVGPTITLSEDTNYAKSHTVEISAIDNGGVESIKYMWTESAETPQEGWITLVNSTTVTKSDGNGTHYLHIQAEDSSGNISFAHTTRRFDNEVPEINLIRNENWAKSHSITLNVSDKHSGLENVEYAWSSSTTVPTNWTVSRNGAIITNNTLEGVRYLHVRATDNVGHITTSFTERKFDNTAPTLVIESNNNYAKSHSVQINASDAASGVRKVEYAWTNSAVKPTAWTEIANNSAVSKADGTGLFYLHVQVTDVAGNTFATSTTRRFDNTGPTILLPDDDTWTKETHSVTLNATDEHSGLDKIEYAWSTSSAIPSEWSNGSVGQTITYTSSDISYLHVRAIDKLGNTSLSYSERKFDKAGPIINVEDDETFRPVQNVVLDIVDVGSGVAKVEYNWSTSTSTPTTWLTAQAGDTVTRSTGLMNVYLHIRATDHLGNVSTKRVLRKMDTTMPSLQMYNASYFNQYVIIVAADMQSGMKTLKYVQTPTMVLPENPEWIEIDVAQKTGAQSFNIDLSHQENGVKYIHVYGEDKAGLVRTISTSQILDKTLPVVTLSGADNPNTWVNSLPLELKTSDNYGIKSIEVNYFNEGNPNSVGRTQLYSNLSTTELEKVVNLNFTPTRSFTDRVEFTITDVAENQVIVSRKAKVDIDKPSMDTSYRYIELEGFWDKHFVDRYEIGDSLSGLTFSGYAVTRTPTAPVLERDYIRVSNGETATYTNESGIFYVHFLAKDLAGNVLMKTQILRQDMILPTINLEVNTTTSRTHEVVINASDTLSGIKKVEYQWTSSQNRPTSGWIETSAGARVSHTSLAATLHLHVKVTDVATNEAYSYTTRYFR